MSKFVKDQIIVRNNRGAHGNYHMYSNRQFVVKRVTKTCILPRCKGCSGNSIALYEVPSIWCEKNFRALKPGEEIKL